jgi:hypothetical protein
MSLKQNTVRHSLNEAHTKMRTLMKEKMESRENNKKKMIWHFRRILWQLMRQRGQKHYVIQGSFSNQ